MNTIDARRLVAALALAAVACSASKSSPKNTTPGAVYCDVSSGSVHTCYGYGNLPAAQQDAVTQDCTVVLQGAVSGSCPSGEVGCCTTHTGSFTTTECYYAGTLSSLQSACQAESGAWSGAVSTDAGSSSVDATPSGMDAGGSASDATSPSQDTSSASCSAGEAQCPKGCASLQTDVNNCGSCGYACPLGPPETSVACSAGQCVATCNAPLMNCSFNQTPNCIDVTSDPDHCGSCNNECPGGAGGQASCTLGSCGVACPNGTSYCSSGGCVDTNTNAAYCGSGCVNCMAQAVADGLPQSSIGSVTCNQGACQAQVRAFATGSVSSAGQTCDQICQASLRVGCSTTNAPASCPTGGCAFYDGVPCEDDEEVGCTNPIAASDGCGALSNVQCACSGTANL